MSIKQTILFCLVIAFFAACGPNPEDVKSAAQAGLTARTDVILNRNSLGCPDRPFLVFEEVKRSTDEESVVTPSPLWGWWLDRTAGPRSAWTLPWDAPEDAGRYHWAASMTRHSFYHTAFRVPAAASVLESIPVGRDRFFNLSSPSATAFVGTTAYFHQYEIGFRILRRDATSWSLAGFEVPTPNPGSRISNRQYFVGEFPDISGTGTRAYLHELRAACMQESVGMYWYWDEGSPGTSSLDQVTGTDVMINKVSGCYTCANR
jgi:hypothetical protein